MDRDEIEALRAKVQQAQARIAEFDTPEHEARLKVAVQTAGLSLRRFKKGSAGFAVKTSDGSEISGVTLADVEELLRKSEAGPRP